MATENTKILNKKAKKNWYQIVAPKLFADQIIGKSLVHSPENLMNKSISVNLMNLTGDIRSQNINIGFKVLGIKNGQGMTDVWSYKLIPAHVKRIVRRKQDKIEDSFTIKTKDNIKLRIKPLILTLNKTSGAVRAELRRTMKNALAQTFESYTYEDVLRQILMRKLQFNISRELKKITPVKTCELRILERLSQKAEEKAKIIAPIKEIKKKTEKKVAVKKEKKEKVVEQKEE